MFYLLVRSFAAVFSFARRGVGALPPLLKRRRVAVAATSTPTPAPATIASSFASGAATTAPTDQQQQHPTVNENGACRA